MTLDIRNQSHFFRTFIMPPFYVFCVEYAKSMKYTEIQRPVIDEDIVKAIKFKLNNEEQAFKKQHDEQPQ